MKFKSFLKIAGLATAGMAISNVYINESAKKRSAFSDADGYYYTWKEGDVYYTVSGSGSPVLLVHDLNVISNSYEWHNLVNLLKKNHKVYCIDLLGCGLSQKPSITYTNYLYVQLLEHFVKDVIGQKCHVIASHDSTAAVIMAQKTADVFEKIVLINPTDFETMSMETTRADKLFKDIMFLPIIGNSIYNYGTSEKNIKALLLSYFSHTRDWSETVDAYYKAAHLDNSKGKYLYACKRCNYLGGDIRFALSDMKNISIIYGRDYVTGERIARAYKEICPKIKVYSVRNTKQVPQLENPEGLYEILDEIIS